MYHWDFLLAQKRGDRISYWSSSRVPWWSPCDEERLDEELSSSEQRAGDEIQSDVHGVTQSEQQRPALNPAAFQASLAFSEHPAAFCVE